MGLKKPEIQEIDILTMAADALKQNTGIAYTIKPDENNIGHYITIELPDRRRKCEFAVEIVRNPVGWVAHETDTKKNRRLLVTSYINPNLAERFKNMGIQFISCTGNVYINTGAIFLFIKGKKSDKTLNGQSTHHFNPSGLQILFVLHRGILEF